MKLSGKSLIRGMGCQIIHFSDLAALVTAQLAQNVRNEQENKTMLNDIYESNSNWLKADDIKGRKPVVTITAAEVKDVFEKKQIVLTFEGKDKQLGLNFTNASKISELTGTEDFTQWVGVSIKLMVEKVKFQNSMVDAIRIFPELPNGQQAIAATEQFSGPAADDDIPF